ncbi:hypothetical protein [Magnetospirillum molischianum]|uniref:hypothetical protein n=1 Tax=Magnetospirillum molischianum TaxID=1083 RepID=UPI0002EE8929|nr:hypothetical protein [Magnetospirillum molischianum]
MAAHPAPKDHPPSAAVPSNWRPVGGLVLDILRRAAGNDPARLAAIAAMIDGGRK